MAVAPLGQMSSRRVRATAGCYGRLAHHWNDERRHHCDGVPHALLEVWGGGRKGLWGRRVGSCRSAPVKSGVDLDTLYTLPPADPAPLKPAAARAGEVQTLHFAPRMAYVIPLALVFFVWAVIIWLSERHGLLDAADRFPNAAAKWFAYLWLGLFMLVLAVLVTGSALTPVTVKQLAGAPFYTLFALHAVLIVFLAGWWAVSGMPNLKEFLNIRHERPAEVLAIGTAVGVGGWIGTLALAAMVGLLLRATGALDNPPEPPAMIGWMAALPLWKKALIVLSAMTVEEFFFRSFLQKRIGLIASTILFALAHFTYGNPLMLIGVTIISFIIGLTFYRTKNVVPGILAHGVFDAIQLFVIVPIAVKVSGIGS